MVYLEIPGEPVAKGRPRMTKTGIVYTPAKTLNYETLIRQLYVISKQGMLKGTLRAEINAHFQTPQNISKTKRALMERGKHRPIKRPDLDNLAKAVLDALNGLAYSDDSQVVSLTVDKYYSDNPRVEVTIKEV